MRLAINEAKKAYEIGEIPVGAVIVYEGKVIASSHNCTEGNALATSHAELLAIEMASKSLGRWRLTGCTMYVTLEPCAMCAGALVASRIDRLVFGAYDPKGGACGSLMNICQDERLNHRLDVIGGVLQDECSLLLKAFFKELRHRKAR